MSAKTRGRRSVSQYSGLNRTIDISGVENNPYPKNNVNGFAQSFTGSGRDQTLVNRNEPFNCEIRQELDQFPS